ncbi:MAG: NAD-dependent epimerase/dehydratase family protein [Candidatus Hydrogenedentota bacterium]|nr:MAG: NAD-dependent epimerase/dehydratase family protein [Candidatus Hydrogenedentota bacterium]
METATDIENPERTMEAVNTILVTGGSGLLGRTLQPFLPGAVFVSSRDADLQDPAAAERLIAQHQPKILVHLAARGGGVLENARFNLDLLEENLLINTNTLRAARNAGVRRFILVLSGCVWDLEDGATKTESSLHDGLPYQGNLGYAFSKRTLDIHARLLRNEGCVVDCLVPVTLFGPYDEFDSERGHVVGALIHRALDAKRTGAPLRVWGTGKAVRQFLFAEDAARAIARLLHAPRNDTFILAADQGITIAELARKIADLVRPEMEILFDPQAPEGAARKVLSGERWRQAFPDFPFTPLDEALRITINWYRNEQRRRAEE